MKLIPQKRIFIVGMVILVLFLIIVNVSSHLFVDNQVPTNKNDNVTNNSNLVNGSSFESVRTAESVNDKVLSRQNSTLFLNIIGIIVCALFILLANLSYLYVLNSDDVLQLVSVSLKLAGFSSDSHRIGRIGRKWKISSESRLELHGGLNPKFYLIHNNSSISPDPRMYGLKVSTDQIITEITPETLQLTLLSFHRFLRDETKAELEIPDD